MREERNAFFVSGLKRVWFGALSLLLLSLLAGCANPAFQAYEATPIFGESREVVHTNNQYTYQFAYRGGTVTYNPATGAEWKDDARQDSRTDGTMGSGKKAASLPNGCLVFACARAEEIRRTSPAQRPRSQVIGYTRADGTGHAFVLFEEAGAALAEDDRGCRLTVPAWKTRSAEEALALAKTFQRLTHPADFPDPIRASFIGTF